MFYSETILSRRGPLGRVWLAAHMERKLSKTQTLQTDIEESVTAIMGQEVELMALRLSGQLLLGVVRIYSRKAKYLLDDCNEALLKIKMAFRPGVVDLTEDQLTVNRTAITLPTNGIGIDLLLPDVDWDMDFEDRPLQRQGHHQAHIDDITLRTADDFHLGTDPFDIGPSDGIASGDFLGDLDLGINWDDDVVKGHDADKSDGMSVEGSIGVGRNADFSRHSLEPDLLNGGIFGTDRDALSHASRDPSEQPFDIPMDIDTFPEVDLGNLGIGFDDIPPLDAEDGKTPSETRSLSRASSPLTDVPNTPPAHDETGVVVAGELPVKEKVKRRVKDKKQIIDAVTELQNENSNRGRAALNTNPLNTDTSDITTEQHFLPRSSIVMRLLEIRDDPVAYFLSSQGKTHSATFSVAPPGLSPALAELFVRPISGTTLKRKGATQEGSPNKRGRHEELEVARRADSVALSEHNLNLDEDSRIPDAGFDFGDQSGQIEDYQLDVSHDLHGDLDGGRASVFSERSRLSSVGPGALDDEGGYVVDSSCPVAVFDFTQPSQAHTQPGGIHEVEAAENDTGYSKNTIKALNLIREELQSADEDQEEKSLSFLKMTNKASRRAASSFFFEVLVLGTRDCVKVKQASPFADIEVQAKPRLWDQQQAVPDELGRTSVPLGND